MDLTGILNPCHDDFDIDTRSYKYYVNVNINTDMIRIIQTLYDVQFTPIFTVYYLYAETESTIDTIYMQKLGQQLVMCSR